MSMEIEGIAPNSDEANALKELQEEGHIIGNHQPIDDEGNTKEPEPKATPEVKEEPKQDEPVKEQKARTPSMVEAWKLKVAEDQKESALKDKADLEAKLEALSKQRPETIEQKQEVADDIDALIKEAEEAGSDGAFLRKFANTLLAKSKPSDEVTKTIAEIKEQKELQSQLNDYTNEFIDDVLPLVKDYNLSDTALSELKENLKGYAFSDIYAKLPLSEIFQLKKSELNLHEPKRSSEGKGVKMRASEVVDLENLDEDSFNKLDDESILKIGQKDSSGWTRR